MLADQPRTTKYHSVILQNKESLKDKVILDVGCGTGIISLFCAHHARPKAVSQAAASMSDVVSGCQVAAALLALGMTSWPQCVLMSEALVGESSSWPAVA
jgi:predicted RNA methylase